MNKEVKVEKSNLPIPAEIAALATLGQAAVATAGDIGTGEAFGQFTKQGEWIFGQEQIETEEGALWAINPLMLKHGFIHWPDEGRPTEMMVLATQPLPKMADLPHVDGNWDKNAGFQAICRDGEDEGQQVIFKGSSMGFRKAWADVLQAIAKQAVEGAGEVVPVVSLESSSYTHKKYGKIMTPKIVIMSWLTLDGLEVAEEDGEGAGPTKAEEKVAKPEPKPEAKAEKAEPTRRRRRRKAV